MSTFPKSEKRLDELQEKFGDKIEPLHSDKINIAEIIEDDKNKSKQKDGSIAKAPNLINASIEKKSD